jgi:2-desacetyl-2-hydroxyethyl bacteriochlorophyllide A dehydrogenase
MKVMVYTRPREMRIEQRPYPALAPGEVVLRVDASGICGSDLNGYFGHDRTRSPGMILGHEICGTVMESASPHYPKGLRVTANSAWSCGRCDYCVSGRDNLCDERKSMGKHRPGGYSEFVAIPASALIDIPQDMEPVRAALTEPVAVALHTINLAMKSLSRPISEARALVLGGGAIGFLGAMVLRSYACRALMLAEINPLRRVSAQRHIGCDTCDPREAEPEANVYDFVLDAVGSTQSLAIALKAARKGGVIAEAGLHDNEVSLDIQKLTRAQVSLIGAANYPTTELRAAVRLLNSGAFGDLSFVQQRPLDEGPRAFAELADGTVAYPKIMLMPQAA